MPKFFFDVTDGSRHWIDSVGGNLADEHAARLEAMHTLAERIRGQPLSGHLLTFTCLVRDAERHPLWNVVLAFSFERAN